MKLLLSLVLAFSAQAFALDLPVGSFDALAVKSSTPLDFENASLFEGIVKLSNCSGAVVIFDGMSTMKKALVLTNGHCLGGGFLKPGEVVVNRRGNRSMRVYDNKMKLHSIRATKIVYATMTDTDAALYELDVTYDQLLSQNKIRPLLMADTRPLESTQINIPSGYWDRNWACQIDGFVHRLLEANWVFTDSIRYMPGCNTIGGTSGSPLVERGTRTVIGINNTSNESGGRCTMNNPCEQDEAGRVVVIAKRSYGQQTYQFYGCMNEEFDLDLTLSSCTLPK